MNVTTVVAALTCAALAACAPEPPPPPPVLQCIGGYVHRLEGGVWWRLDGRAFIGRPDGPISCAADQQSAQRTEDAQ